MLVFSSCNPELFAVRHSHHPVSAGVVTSSEHCCTKTVLTSSEHYCMETVAPSGDHCFTETVAPSSNHYDSRFKIFIHSNHLPWYIEDNKISINS